MTCAPGPPVGPTPSPKEFLLPLALLPTRIASSESRRRLPPPSAGGIYPRTAPPESAIGARLDTCRLQRSDRWGRFRPTCLPSFSVDCAAQQCELASRAHECCCRNKSASTLRVDSAPIS